LNEITEILDGYHPISLDDMDSVKLMDRTDTKFLLKLSHFPMLLGDLRNDYQCLEVNGTKTSTYSTTYLDTKDLDFYIKHHNGKKNRYKVRFRKYCESDLTFLEIKFKTNKSRTIKNRVIVQDFEETLSEDSQHFIKEISGINYEITNVLKNDFKRITLVSTERKERLTLDFNLEFNAFGKHVKMGDVVICELKQEKANRDSPFVRAVQNYFYRQMRISKYCMGIALTKNGVKRNNFKENLMILNKFNNDYRVA
jgi:hypothetical protein